MRKPQSGAENGLAELLLALSPLLEGKIGEGGGKRGLFGGRKRAESPTLRELGDEAFFEAARALGVEGSALLLFAGKDDPLAIALASPAYCGEAESLLRGLCEAGGFGAEAGGLLLDEELSPSALGLLASRIGGGRSYSARAGRLLLFLEEGAAQDLAQAIVGGHKLSPSKGYEAPAVQNIRIGRNIDFVIGHFLLPPFFPSGPVSPDGKKPGLASVFWDCLSAPPKSAAEGQWFAGSLGEGGDAISCLYLIECGDDRTALPRVAACLAQGWGVAARRIAALRGTGLEDSRKAEAAIHFVALREAPPGVSAAWPAAYAQIHVGRASFRVQLAIPSRLLTILSSSGKEARLLSPAGSAGSGETARLFAANESFLLHWGGSRFDPWLAIPREGQALPALAPLLSALGPRDASVVIQNHIIPEAGAAALPGLFLWRARSGDRQILVPLMPFDAEAIYSLLPENARDEWPGSLSHGALSPAAAQRVSDSPVACLERGSALLASLIGGLRSGRLLLSPGGRALIQERVALPLEAADRKELEAMAEADEPFGFLASLHLRLARYLVDRIPNRDLGMAMAGGKSRLEVVATSMSKGRLGEFKDELDAIERRFERGNLTARDLVNARKTLRSNMEALLDALEEEEGRAASPGIATRKEKR